MPRPNRGKYLRQKPDGVWEVRWTDEGRSRRYSTGTKDRREAEQILAQIILAEGGGTIPKRTPPTVGRILDYYETDIAQNAISRETLLWNVNVLRAFFGDILVHEITQGDIDEFIRDRLAGLVTYVDANGVVRGGGPVTLGTIRSNLQMLRTAFNHAMKTRRLVAGELPYFKLPPTPKARARWLTRDEAARLLAAAQPDPQARLTREYRFIATALFTATRRAVICKLPWSRIDLDKKEIDFQDPARPRTKKRTGVIPISDEFLPIVKRAYDERTSAWWLDRPTYPIRGFDRACAEAGLDDVHPHVLRHTWATWAAQDGVDLWTIANVLHDTVATVERTYAHITTDHLRTALNRRTLLPRLVTDEPLDGGAAAGLPAR